MAKNYAEIAFTPTVKLEQEKHGARRQYERMERLNRGTELSFAEVDFIGSRDSFYIASTGENGYPYVQFRGGPPGFLKVLDSKTLGYADFQGNLQYVSVGNFKTNEKAALILMDYRNRRRLKIYARAEIRDAGEEPELITKLTLNGYDAKVERAILLHVDAFDWNCPQHITPRYTTAEIDELLIPYRTEIERLEKENKELRAK
jgi:predicted pyridoxine 5'-phosphate oxidase superfamily flavin-nucleotide-binding protein